MKISFTAHAWQDYLYWQVQNKQTLKRINLLIKDILRSPFNGIGDPEALKYDYSGFWSRRIDLEHRLVYRIEEGLLIIIQCRYHY